MLRRFACRVQEGLHSGGPPDSDLSEFSGPRLDEALATLMHEGCRHKMAVLVDGPDGPTVISVMEVETSRRPGTSLSRARHDKRLSCRAARS